MYNYVLYIVYLVRLVLNLLIGNYQSLLYHILFWHFYLAWLVYILSIYIPLVLCYRESAICSLILIVNLPNIYEAYYVLN